MQKLAITAWVFFLFFGGITKLVAERLLQSFFFVWQSHALMLPTFEDEGKSDATTMQLRSQISNDMQSF